MKISIVTIHLNNFAGLERTCVSLNPVRKLDAFEWIVIDGDSQVRDGAGAILAQVQACADRFVSEPDEGIYDAMNKGSRLATGAYVLYLNAGDQLHPDFNPARLLQTADTSSADMIWGWCQERYENGSLVTIKTRSPAWAWYGMPAYHPGIFFRWEVLGNTPYDKHYRIAADYELLSRLLKGGAQVARYHAPVAIFHRGGLSETHADDALAEENHIRLKYFRIPASAARVIKGFKAMNARLARLAWFRGLWRKWI